MIMPSIALPTGAYDWDQRLTPPAVYRRRLADLRSLMDERGVTHAIVYGNTFDHADLLWFSNFTPKLGPALMLVGLDSAPRILFSGGPGMKPSAQRLTWIEEVAALRGLGRDVTSWLEGAVGAVVGIIAGASCLHGDWSEMEAAVGSDLADLSADSRMQRGGSQDEVAAVRVSARLLQETADRLHAAACEGSDLLTAVFAAERAAYALGAQDVRMRVARKPWGRPLTLSDTRSNIHSPLPVAMAVRCAGYWAAGEFVLGDLADRASVAASELQRSESCVAYDNRVAFPEADAVVSGLVEVSAEAHGARWTALCVRNGVSRDWLFWPPGL